MGKPSINIGDGNWATKEGFLEGYRQDDNDKFLPVPATVERVGAQTYFDRNGVLQTALDDVPCIDYIDNPNGALSMPPQSTNTFINSEPTASEGGENNISYEAFDWGNGLPFTNCVRYIDNTATRWRYGSDITNNNVWVLSCFVVMDDLSEPQISKLAGSDFGFISNGTSSYIDYSTLKKEPLPNNVWRCSVKIISNVAGNLDRQGILKSASNTAKGFRVAGWQCELDELTPYIKTDGSTATRYVNQVTGIGDVNSFNSEEGVLYWRGKATGETSTIIGISDGLNSNKIEITLNVPSSRIDVILVDGGVNSFIFNYSADVLIEHEIAVKWKVNDFALYVDGVEVLTDTSGTVSPNAWSGLNLSNVNKSGNFLQAKTKNLRVYKSIADAQIDLPYII